MKTIDTDYYYSAAEALQSENLTLKKAVITLYKGLIQARNQQIPHIEGVDWESDKVANGKSGRALNYIISEEARVDNRISGEEIASYDSDSQMPDNHANDGKQLPCPDSPNSQYSYSPRSSAADMGWMYETPQTEDFDDRQILKKRKSSRYSYSPAAENSVMGTPVDGSNLQEAGLIPRPPGAPFIDPNLLQPSGSIGSTFAQPPTPPNTLDSTEFMRAQSRLRNDQMQWPNDQQQMLFNNSILLQQQYGEVQQGRMMVTNAPGPSMVATASPPGDVQWANGADYYQFLGAEKEELRRFVVALPKKRHPSDE